MRRVLLVVVFCCSIALAACRGEAPSPASDAQARATPASGVSRENPPVSATPTSPAQVSPANAVSARAREVAITAGAAAEAEVEVIIADGYHVNANPASYPYLRPTALMITSADDITSGAPIYPSSEMKKFAFAEAPIAVYEGTVKVRVPVRAARHAPPGAHTLQAKVQAQPCNDEACFPPRVVEMTIPVMVR